MKARVPALLMAVLVLLAAVGCDVMEKQDENRQFVGRYAAETGSDVLQLAFTPHPDYNEEDESPYLPDTTLDLLGIGATLEMVLDAEGSAANQGSVSGGIDIPRPVYLDADSMYALVPDTTASFDGRYVAVIDRVFLKELSELQPEDTTAARQEVTWTLPLPREWTRSGNRLTGTTASIDVRGLVYFFNFDRGRQDSMITTIGQMTLEARLSRQ